MTSLRMLSLRVPKLFVGGSPLGGSGYFYPITLLGNVDNGHRIVDRRTVWPSTSNN